MALGTYQLLIRLIEKDGVVGLVRVSWFASVVYCEGMIWSRMGVQAS